MAARRTHSDIDDDQGRDQTSAAASGGEAAGSGGNITTDAEAAHSASASVTTPAESTTDAPHGDAGGTPPPGPTPPPGNPYGPTPPEGATGFYGWLRSLGVPRQPGWIGGVCAGVAARLGIDPVIVRGVLVVFALFAPVAFLLYGLAWLFLPDTAGRIHLEELLHGRFSNAIIGIAAFVVVGLLPIGLGDGSIIGRIWGGVISVPWSWGPWGGLGGLPGVIGGVLSGLFTIALIGGLIALVIWGVRRASSGPAPQETTPQAAFAQYQAEGAAVAPTAGADDAASEPAAEPAAPAQPTTDATTDEYAEWKQRYDAWRVEHETWRRAQADANRTARAQLAAENKARAAEFTAKAEAARRERRRVRPRASFAFVIAVLGAALLGGSLAAFAALGGSNETYSVTIGLAVATLIAAISMIVAGLLRRRSGFLAFVTIVLTVLMLASSAVPRTGELRLGNQNLQLYGIQSFVIPAGTAYVTANADSASSPPARLEITQGAGNVYIDVYDDVRVRVEARYDSGGWWSVNRIDRDGEVITADDELTTTGGGTGGESVIAGTVGGSPGDSPDAFVSVRGLNGGIQVTIHEENR